MTFDEFFDKFALSHWHRNGFEILHWHYVYDHELIECLVMLRGGRMTLDISFAETWENITHEGEGGTADAEQLFYELTTQFIKLRQLEYLFDGENKVLVSRLESNQARSTN